MSASRRSTKRDDAFLPMTREEVDARGWDEVDVVFVTGDAYVDHPSFAMAILGRVLESEGLRVAILSQPDWRSCDDWKTFGRPRIMFAVSAGNMDSMLNHYTANKKVRNDDAFSPGGKIGRRPDRATLSYCQRAREAYKGVPIIVGGVEASLRRLAHFDYWSEKVRRSILLDSKADLLVYGMGESPILEIVRRLKKGESTSQIRDVLGTAFRLGAAEVKFGFDQIQPKRSETFDPYAYVELPSFEDVQEDSKEGRKAFAEMTRLAYLETNPSCGRRLIQRHGPEAIVVNPPSEPLTERRMDDIYGLPFQRLPHPSYGDERIPALEVVKDSIQIMRGCFGGCSFCSLTAHQGRVIQSRSQESVLEEVRRMTTSPRFHGVISDLGGPSANMYRMGCSSPEIQSKCRKTSCLHPTICKNLNADHGPLLQLMRAVRKESGVKQAFIASGVRTDLARHDAKYMEELTAHHVGGQLKVAPEHVDDKVLLLMKKPPIEDYEQFCSAFNKATKKARKGQYLVPYLISGHPGSDLKSMVRTAEYLKEHNIRPEQVQDFIPGPFDLATCMYYTDLDPMSGRKVYVPSGGRERRLQKALLLYYKPEKYFDVREALEKAGRTDLIGAGPHCLIRSNPPKGVVRKGKGGKSASGKGPRSGNKSSDGYRPHRKSAKRRKR
jgi:uncharacterized radical SAM protein YgiQ